MATDTDFTALVDNPDVDWMVGTVDGEIIFQYLGKLKSLGADIPAFHLRLTPAQARNMADLLLQASEKAES